MASTIAQEKGADTVISPDKLEGSGNTSLDSNFDHHGIDEKKLVRKIDWRILPGVILLYLLSFLDRSNVANAKVEGLAADTKMSSLYCINFLRYLLTCTKLETNISPA
jgi:hypothetical protein